MRSDRISGNWGSPGDRPPDRRFQAVSWWLSLLAVLGIGAWLVTYFVEIRYADSSTNQTPTALVLRVTSVMTGEPIPNAEIRTPTQVVFSGQDGIAQIAYPVARITVQVTHPDFEPVYGEVPGDVAPEQLLALTPRQ